MHAADFGCAIEIGQHAGLVLLITLMAFALYNDIYRLIGG